MNNPTTTPENATTNNQNNNADPKNEQKNAAPQNPAQARGEENAVETDIAVDEDTDTEAAQ